MDSKSIILSVVVISHNQRELLRRCLESIFKQQMSFFYEVIVSDDRSTDGTREMLETEYKDRVFATYCNSDDCNPAMTAERATYNRINGLRYAKGKYLIHVDGDDYFVGTTVLQRQVEALEKHPECNICAQGYLDLQEGEDLSKGIVNKAGAKYKDGDVISADEFIKVFPYIHNTACCVRNLYLLQNSEPVNRYDDISITYRYIGINSIVLIDSVDFIHVHYGYMTASCFNRIDQEVLWLTCVSMLSIAPQLAGSMLRNGFKEIRHVVHLARRGCQLQEESIKYINNVQEINDMFIFRYFAQDKCVWSKFRLNILWIWMLLISYCHLDADWVYRILYQLAVKKEIDKGIRFARAL